MPANFLHGVETIVIDKGPRPITGVKTAVIGLVGTAPIQTVDPGYQTLNEPVVVRNPVDAAKYFGEVTTGYTIPAALDAIFDQGNGPICIVVNVFNPATHVTDTTPDPSKVLASDIIGAVDVDGDRSGLQCLIGTYNLFGYVAKILIAPGFCTQEAVSTEMISVAERLRAMALIDAPIGTTVNEAIAGRGASGTINFETSSTRAVLCFPHVKRYDSATDAEVLEPLSQRLAGVMAAKDIERGYWWSPSNSEVKGITGMEIPITALINDSTTEANALNEAGILTVFNSFGTGIRTWGNRSSAYPTSTAPVNFICVQRVADILHESVEYSMLQFIDRPINQALIDTIRESVNGFIRTLVMRGAVIDGRCVYDKAKNPETEVAAGHLTFDIEFMPPTPAERITFESYINIELLQTLQ
ncbi:MAG: phage tail sheath subtilisin-like domain-containing protein [Desulfobulbus sp.]